MDYQIAFTPQELCNVILAICGAVITISAALAVLIRFINKAKMPNKVQDERISALENEVQKIEDRLKLGNRRFEMDAERADCLESNMKKFNKVIIESLQALTSHAIDGNGIDELKGAKRALEEYLISK